VVTDLGVYYALAGGIASSVGAAKGISYLAGVVVGFALNKFWTFESRRRSWAEPASYLALYLMTLGVNVGCNHFALAVLGGEHRLTAFLVATGVTTVLNFLGMRLVAFRRGIQERRSVANSLEASVVTTRKAG
jgi:putative flippase GtrA